MVSKLHAIADLSSIMISELQVIAFKLIKFVFNYMHNMKITGYCHLMLILICLQLRSNLNVFFK